MFLKRVFYCTSTQCYNLIICEVLAEGTKKIVLRRVSVLSCPSSLWLSQSVPEDGGFLYDKVAVDRDAVKETPCRMCLSTRRVRKVKINQV